MPCPGREDFQRCHSARRDPRQNRRSPRQVPSPRKEPASFSRRRVKTRYRPRGGSVSAAPLRPPLAAPLWEPGAPPEPRRWSRGEPAQPRPVPAGSHGRKSGAGCRLRHRGARCAPASAAPTPSRSSPSPSPSMSPPFPRSRACSRSHPYLHPRLHLHPCPSTAPHAAPAGGGPGTVGAAGPSRGLTTTRSRRGASGQAGGGRGEGKAGGPRPPSEGRLRTPHARGPRQSQETLPGGLG